MPSSHLRQPSVVHELIAHLYDAAMDDSLWPGTASRIAAAFGSTSAVLKLHGNEARVMLLECTDNLILPERRQAWADDWHRRDLWVQRSVAHGMSKILTDEDLVTPDEQARSGFYQEWLRHLGIHHLLGAVFPTTGRTIGVLGIHRPGRAGAYALPERRQAMLLLPHLQRALRLRERLAVVSGDQAASRQALDRLDTAVLLVDDSGRVLHASAMADHLLRANPQLTLLHGRLSARSPALHDRLMSLLRAAMDGAHGRLAEAGAALSIPRPQRMPLTLEVAPLRRPAAVFTEQRSAVLVFIRDPEAPIAAARLRELFGLTRSESAVAAALGHGSSLAEIAADLGIGLATARSHVKRILVKTGTHRQAAAAALLARSVATAAHVDG